MSSMDPNSGGDLCINGAMGMETEVNPYNSNDSKLFADNDGSDSFFNNQALGEMGPDYNFGSILSSQDIGTEPLSNSMLNSGIDALCVPKHPDHGTAMNQGAIVPMASNGNQHQNRYQQNAIAKQSLFSPSATTIALHNTTPGKVATYPSTQYTIRRSSLLRNECFPDNQPLAPSSMMTNYAHPNRVTSSPSHHALYPPPSSSSSSNLRGVQDNSVPSPVDQCRDYNFHQEFAYDPTLALDQHHLLSSFNHFSHLQQHPHQQSGQMAYESQNQHSCQAEAQSYQPKDEQPSTPPSKVTSMRDINTPRMSETNSRTTAIKREASASGSPQAKRASRKFVRSKTAGNHNESDADAINTKTDAHYVQELVNAMIDGTDAEDNQGMLNTWNKILEKKSDKLREKCVEFLHVLKRAQYEQLVEKKAVNLYPNFDHRFQETCAALRSQKTVCKHLMEVPYSHTVANDPTFAAQRVRNNRRVNGQKRQAIRMGRQALGLEGQGKGRSMKKIDPIPFDELYDEDNSGDDPDADDDDDLTSTPSPVIKPRSSSRKDSKKARKADSDDNSDDDFKPSPAPQKAKRVSRTAYKVIDDGPHSKALKSTANSIGSPSNGLPSNMSSSPIQHHEPMRSQRTARPSDLYNASPAYGLSGYSSQPSLSGYYEDHDQFGSNFQMAFASSMGYPSETDSDQVHQRNGGSNSNASGSVCKRQNVIDLK